MGQFERQTIECKSQYINARKIQNNNVQFLTISLL